MLSYNLLLTMVGIKSKRQCPSMRCSVPAHSAPLEEDFMSGILNFVEIEGQHVELLPTRTVLSLPLLSTGGYGCEGGGHVGESEGGNGGIGDIGGIGGIGGAGGTGMGGIGANV
jgi:hypothetical protein